MADTARQRCAKVYFTLAVVRLNAVQRGCEHGAIPDHTAESSPNPKQPKFGKTCLQTVPHLLLV